jgi:hypothetical protein
MKVFGAQHGIETARSRGTAGLRLSHTSLLLPLLRLLP